jgi:hypothetical protein
MPRRITPPTMRNGEGPYQGKPSAVPISSKNDERADPAQPPHDRPVGSSPLGAEVKIPHRCGMAKAMPSPTVPSHRCRDTKFIRDPETCFSPAAFSSANSDQLNDNASWALARLISQGRVRCTITKGLVFCVGSSEQSHFRGLGKRASLGMWQLSRYH